ncbi:MAG: arginine--tRNA ligase [Nanoarchaeota archaeon]
MKEQIIHLLHKNLSLSKEELERLIEIPKDSKLGDYAFPCFTLAKTYKKNPAQIAQELVSTIKPSSSLEKIVATGPYINFFLDRKYLSKEILNKILSKKDKYGSSDIGKGKTLVIDMSSPNIAKPFGVGHLRSTIIGNSIALTAKQLGYKTIKINYLGDWGLPFGKVLAGYKKFGNSSKLKKEGVKHLYEIYVKSNNDESMESEAKHWLKKLESGDKEAKSFWKNFRSLSLREFDKVYRKLNISFDIISGESQYTDKKIDKTLKELNKKGLLKESEGATIVDLSRFGYPPCLIKKTDGAALYSTRDITAAIERYKKYKFSVMLYEVGAEQKLHFKQIFKVLELMGYSWAKNCIHIDHGLYLDTDGKKLSTRRGKTIFMEDLFSEIEELAKKEILNRSKISGKDLEKRIEAISLAAILYGDLKNHRTNDAVLDIEKFLSFEGDTGPYLLYTYARAKSILSKASYKKSNYSLNSINDREKNLILQLSYFPDVVSKAFEGFSPNIIANYTFQLAQTFNEFYHKEKVIGSENQEFRLALIDAFSQVLKNSLYLLGIPIIEKM